MENVSNVTEFEEEEDLTVAVGEQTDLEGALQTCVCFLTPLQYRNKLGFSGYETVPEVTL